MKITFESKVRAFFTRLTSQISRDKNKKSFLEEAASPADEPVRIEAGEVGDQIHLRVVDRGPGVAPEQRARLFEPFQRLGDESNGSGVGLGLAVARGLVAAVGGELSAEDTPGGGLTMVIALPEMAR